MTSKDNNPQNILNSTFLKDGEEVFKNKDYQLAEENYRHGMEYALEHEKMLVSILYSDI